MRATKVVSLFFAIIIASLFYYLIRQPNLGFNFIPYLIHQEFFRKTIKESTFILVFDILISLFLFVLSYVLLSKWIRSHKTSKPDQK